MIALAQIIGNLDIRGLISQTEAEKTSYIEAAIRFYSQYNPNYVDDEINLEEGIAVYDMPDGSFGVRRIDWWPFGEKKIATDLLKFPELIIPHVTIDTAFNRWTDLDQFRCRWTVEGEKLYIFPTPDANIGEKGITYTACHAFDYSSSSYLTIPDEDDWLITNCALAEYLQAMAMVQSVLPDFTEGLTSIRRGSIVKNVASIIVDLRRGVMERYAV